MNKSGQAAIEFISTYGWALMITAGVIGALIYFGFNPTNSIPNSCSFGDSFECMGSRITPDGQVILNIKNTVGSDVFINATICNHKEETVFFPQAILIKAGEIGQVGCNFETEFEEKDKIKFDLSVVYTKVGFSFPSSAEALVIGSVMNP